MQKPLLLIGCICTLIVTPVFAQSITDIDGDGLTYNEEDKNGNGIVDEGETDPYNADTDSGGESDGSELKFNRNPQDKTDDMTFDRDGDGLNNGEEAAQGTDPFKADTDQDGLNDKEDPFPLDPLNGKQPLPQGASDRDNDGIRDEEDAFPDNPEYHRDGDGDGVPDEWEERHGLSGANAHDANEDNDNDGLSNRAEFLQKTSPRNADSDYDGKNDGTEVKSNQNPLQNICLEENTDPHTFLDIEHHWAKTFIMSLHRTSIAPSNTPIIRGYGLPSTRESVFLADRPVSRFEFLKMALFSHCIQLNQHPQPLRPFFDVTVSSSEESRVIYTAMQHNIVEGYPDHTFRPHDNINRAEAVNILMRMSPEGIPYSHKKPFTDVNIDTWYGPAVIHAWQKSIIDGHIDRTFRPDSFLTRGEATKIIWRALEGNEVVK